MINRRECLGVAAGSGTPLALARPLGAARGGPELVEGRELRRAARTILCLLICAACCIGCTRARPAVAPENDAALWRARPNTLPTAAAEASVAPPIDRLDLFVRNAAREAVQLTLTRDSRDGAEIWYVRRSDGRQRPLGPVEQATDMVVRMLNSFDLWALNEPDAPGAACRTVMGQRSCSITFNDYSLVMRVQRGREVRVQRYTRLEKSTSNQSARALADFVFAWARARDGGLSTRTPHK